MIDRQEQEPRRADHFKQNVEDALDESAHELQLLANFYHQHGYPERAQEIYRTLLKIRDDRDGDHDDQSSPE